MTRHSYRPAYSSHYRFGRRFGLAPLSYKRKTVARLRAHQRRRAILIAQRIGRR